MFGKNPDYAPSATSVSSVTKVLAAVLPSQKECEDEHGKEKELFSAHSEVT